jgi:hypothetical protein
MTPKRTARLCQFLVAALIAAVFVSTNQHVEAEVTVHTRASEVHGPVSRPTVFHLPFAAQHLALHWFGNPAARVSVALTSNATTFGRSVDAGRDEVGEERGNGETYGSILVGDGATAVRVSSDRPIARLTVLDLADGARTVRHQRYPGTPASASVAEPTILPRSAWAADESLRFDSTGKEIWPPAFWPIQKLIVHHTATANNDPDPPSTIRAIYYYHAVTQGWGDIGYNFLIDEAGHVYKGRHSHTTSTPSSASPSPDDTITGENSSGNGVTGAHALNFNSGTVGVALLGTLTNQDATPAAKRALEDLLGWKADSHHIDPQGASLYANPVSGQQTTFPNIAGHRDVTATECPGGTFYATLPTVRSDVAARIAAAGSTTTTTTTTRTTTTTTTTTSSSTTSSSTTTTTAYDHTPPTAPNGLNASPAKRKVGLSWTGSTDAGGSGLTGYRVYRSTVSASAGFALIASTTSTSYTNTGLRSGTTYWYYVVAYDGAGNTSSQSNTVGVTSR